MFILAGEGNVRERGLCPLSNFLPISGEKAYGASKRGVSPSSISSPSPLEREFTLKVLPEGIQGVRFKMTKLPKPDKNGL